MNYTEIRSELTAICADKPYNIDYVEFFKRAYDGNASIRVHIKGRPWIDYNYDKTKFVSEHCLAVSIMELLDDCWENIE